MIEVRLEKEDFMELIAPVLLDNSDSLVISYDNPTNARLIEDYVESQNYIDMGQELLTAKDILDITPNRKFSFVILLTDLNEHANSGRLIILEAWFIGLENKHSQLARNFMIVHR